MYVCEGGTQHICGCPQRPNDGFGFPGAAQHRCWELTSGPLQEQQAFLLMEPSLLPHVSLGLRLSM